MRRRCQAGSTRFCRHPLCRQVHKMGQASLSHSVTEASRVPYLICLDCFYYNGCRKMRLVLYQLASKGLSTVLSKRPSYLKHNPVFVWTYWVDSAFRKALKQALYNNSELISSHVKHPRRFMSTFYITFLIRDIVTLYERQSLVWYITLISVDGSENNQNKFRQFLEIFKSTHGIIFWAILIGFEYTCSHFRIRTYFLYVCPDIMFSSKLHCNQSVFIIFMYRRIFFIHWYGVIVSDYNRPSSLYNPLIGQASLRNPTEWAT